MNHGGIAQLERAADYESAGREFESLYPHQISERQPVWRQLPMVS